MAIATRRSELLRQSMAPFLRYFNGLYAEYENQPGLANFAVGNPHEIAMPQYVDALQRHVQPQDKDWFAYKMSEPEATSVIAASLTKSTGLPWDQQDIQMTNGGFAAIAITLRTLLEPGDEAMFLSPPWFFYEMLIVAAGGTPVRVALDPPGDIDLAAIEQALTPRTRVLILNTPHNPSGRVYTLDELRPLADLLTEAGNRMGHPIYLLGDEPYRRILFDGRRFHSPAEVYPHTVICYSYGKQLLAPGMRIGYVTWAPTMPERERLRDEVFIAQTSGGWAFPNADLQHAMADLEPMCIDLAAMQRRRDHLVTELRTMGYETTWPEGTFYVMLRTPIADDEEFARILARHGVLVLPGTIVELPGWVRLSLTASDEMVDRGLPGFARALAEVHDQ